MHSVRLFNTSQHPSRQPTSLRFRTQPPTLHALQHHPDPTPPSVSLCLAFCHLLLDPGSTCPVTFPPSAPRAPHRATLTPRPRPKTHSHASTHSCPAFSHTHPCLYSAFTLHHSSCRPTRRPHGTLSPSLSVLSPSRTPVHSSCYDLALGFWTQQPPPPHPDVASLRDWLSSVAQHQTTLTITAGRPQLAYTHPPPACP